jgi:hypothetical protein
MFVAEPRNQIVVMHERRIFTLKFQSIDFFCLGPLGPVLLALVGLH